MDVLVFSTDEKFDMLIVQNNSLLARLVSKSEGSQVTSLTVHSHCKQRDQQVTRGICGWRVHMLTNLWYEKMGPQLHF